MDEVQVYMSYSRREEGGLRKRRQVMSKTSCCEGVRSLGVLAT